MFAPRNRPRQSARARSRRGTTSLEFAVTAPILFTLLFGSVELTRMNMIRNTANNAAYEAVRTCVVPGAKASEGVAVAQAFLGSVGVINGTISISPQTITETTPSVTATVTVPYTSSMWFSPLLPCNSSVSASSTMACEWMVSTRQ